jgi:hypothetical protein
MYFFYEIYYVKKNWTKVIKETILMAVLPLLIIIALHYFINVVDTNYLSLSYLFTITNFWVGLKDNFILRLIISIAGFWILLLFNIKRAYNWVRSRIDYFYIILVTIFLSLIVHDFHRVFVYLFPILIPIILKEENKWLIGLAIILSIVYILLNFTFVLF